MIACSISVPNDRERVAVVGDAVEAKPVPCACGQQWKYFHHIVGARMQSDYSCNHQIGEGRMVIIPAAAAFSVNPLSGRFIEILANVGLAVSVLAVDVSQKGVKIVTR